MTKFKNNDIIENRNGQKARVIFIDNVNRFYTIEFLDNSHPNFKGSFDHDINELERFWNVVGSYQGVTPQSASGTQSCAHQWLKYTGLNERFEYCKHCDTKKT